MMERFLQEEKTEKSLCQIPFEMFVKNVQRVAKQKKMEKQYLVFLKKKKKQNWIFKSRIIPPTCVFTSDKAQRSQPIHTLTPHTSIHQTRQSNLTRSQSASLRSDCHKAGRNVGKAQSFSKLRAKWKVAHRSDQLNVFKYNKNDQQNSVAQNCPLFKIRRIPNKNEEESWSQTPNPPKALRSKENITFKKTQNKFSPLPIDQL